MNKTYAYGLAAMVMANYFRTASAMVENEWIYMMFLVGSSALLVFGAMLVWSGLHDD